MEFRALILFLPFILRAAFALEDNANDRNVASACCEALAVGIPGRVFFPDSPVFARENSGYFSALESEQISTCRVNPVSAEEVSDIVRIITEKGCRFAVCSGGHMPWAEAANIDEGVAIDLGFMNTTVLSEDGTVVHAQPGAVWGNLYDLTETSGLTVAGGRSMTVGVGGYLLGGGLSFLSHKYGFASDSVVGYQIVTVEGDILEVTPDSHPDLFWALRVGSTNFGILTRYDIKTYPFSTFWGGLRSFNASYAEVAAEALIDFTSKVSLNGLGTCGLDMGAGDTIFMNFAYFAPDITSDVGSEVFSSTLSIPHLSDTTRANVTQQNLLEEIDSLFTSGQRVLFRTMSFVPDSRLIMDIYRKGLEVFKGSRASWTVQFQPISLSMMDAMKEVNDPQGLRRRDGALMILNIVAFWDDKSMDEEVQRQLSVLRDYGEKAARNRGLWKDWLYLNYAAPDQDPYASFDRANTKRLRAVRDTYDPDLTLQRLWKGGFKL